MALPTTSHPLPRTPLASQRVRELVLVSITMLWGGTFLAVQTALQWSDPFVLVGLRFGLAALMTMLIRGRALRGVTRQELIAGSAIGVALFFGYTLQTIGLESIPSSKSAFLTALYVPMVPLLQWVWLKRSPRAAAWLGIVMAFAGAVLLADPTNLSWAFGLGDAVTILGAFAIAMEIVLMSRLSPGCDPGRLAVIQTVVVALLCAPAAWLRNESLPSATPGLIACVLGLAALTAVIQYAMNWAQQTISATRATLIYSLEPVWAGVVGRLAGERLGPLGLLGGALIVLSIVVGEIRWPRWRRRVAPASRAA